MFRFAKLSLAALIAGALVSGAQAMPIKQPEKPVYPHPQKPVNFNPNINKLPPKIDPAPQPKKPPIIVTPNPKFYPPYYPKYPVVVQTVVEPVYVASRPAVRVAAPAKSSCLTKETTAEGLVIFRDTCTNEVATTAIPGTPAAAAMEAQQAVLAKAMGATGETTGAAEPKKEEEPKK